jgi:hypothetical protein
VVAPAGLAAVSLGLLALVWAMATRPFFYNEQWRAWHLTLPETPWRVSEGTDAPIAFGYAAVSKLSAVLFGHGEVALRLPSLVSLPVLAVLTYVLCRRWLGVLASVLTTLAVLVNRMVLTFAAELAPYTIEAACSVGALLLWLSAREAAPRGRWWRYGVLAVLMLVATPVVLVVAGLFLLDLLRAWRTRQWAYVLPAVAAGLVGLLHVATYVGKQQSQVHGPYWQSMFLPRSPGGFVRGVWRGLANYVPNALTGGTAHFPVVPDGEVWFPAALRLVLMVAMVVGVVAGFVFGFRDREVRPLPVAVAVCIAAQAVASVAHRWPFAYTRVQTFLLPLAYVLVAVGVTRLGGALRARVPWRGVAAAGVAAYAVVLAVGVQQVRVVRAEGQRPAYGTRLPALVSRVRAAAAPTDVVVLHHEMTPKGWAFYMDNASGGVRLGPDRTVTLDATVVRTEPLVALLDAHPEATRVWTVGLTGTHPRTVRAVHQVLAARGWTETGYWREEATGGLREFRRVAP